MPDAPVQRRVRAYFAPVDRTAGAPTLWDPAGIAAFDPDSPLAPWISLGWCSGFARKSATKINALQTGAPASTATQVRSEIDAEVSVEFESWGKLQLALSCGAQQLNVLAGARDIPVGEGSSATQLQLGAGAAGFVPGDHIVVDIDYAGATGFVGSGVSGAYVRPAGLPAANADYVRRVSLNVGRVASVASGVVTLVWPLLAGAPIAGMQAAKVAAFCDREGGSFFQEWSALFLVEGPQGERIAYHYPRLQSMQPAAESPETIGPGLSRLRLAGRFRALPVVDPLDGESIVCFRSFLPANTNNTSRVIE